MPYRDLRSSIFCFEVARPVHFRRTGARCVCVTTCLQCPLSTALYVSPSPGSTCGSFGLPVVHANRHTSISRTAVNSNKDTGSRHGAGKKRNEEREMETHQDTIRQPGLRSGNKTAPGSRTGGPTSKKNPDPSSKEWAFGGFRWARYQR